MDRANPAHDASVLLAFRAENVRSFRDELDLSLVATNIAEPQAVQWVSWREGGNPVGVLPVAGIFGANASGKTNVLRVMEDMRSHVRYSFRRSDPTGGIVRQPFRLDPNVQRSPSRYEVDLVLAGVRYEYGFILDDTHVIEEWALRYPKGKASAIFRRIGDDVHLGSGERARGRAVVDLLRPNALFLSTAASANHPDLLSLYRWFDRNLLLAEADGRRSRQMRTANLLNDQKQRAKVLSLIRAADLGIIGIERHDIPPEVRERVLRILQAASDEEISPEDVSLREVFEGFDIRLIHQGDVERISLSFEDESLGTLVWFGLVGPIVESLTSGRVILVDELDASLHPALVAQLVQLFQDPKTNPHQAQLIFNSHDITVLGESAEERLIGRDQVWFTEKRTGGDTSLYALSDFDPRKHEAVTKRYRAGRYGAVPILSSGEFATIAEEGAIVE